MNRYDIEAKEWKFLAEMKEPRADFSLIWDNLLLFAIGGKSEKGTIGTVECYDETMERWTETTKMPTARSATGAVLFGYYIYVLGGISTEGADLSVVERFNPNIQQWTKVCNIRFKNKNNFNRFFQFKMLNFLIFAGCTIKRQSQLRIGHRLQWKTLCYWWYTK